MRCDLRNSRVGDIPSELQRAHHALGALLEHAARLGAAQEVACAEATHRSLQLFKQANIQPRVELRLHVFIVAPRAPRFATHGVFVGARARSASALFCDASRKSRS